MATLRAVPPPSATANALFSSSRRPAHLSFGARSTGCGGCGRIGATDRGRQAPAHMQGLSDVQERHLSRRPRQRACTCKSGVSTRCSARNHACSSPVRMTSDTSRSLVPSSPVRDHPRRRVVRAVEDHLVRFEQPGQHRRYLLTAVWRPRHPRELRHVPRVADRDAAEGLHPLGDLDRPGRAARSACLSSSRCSW